MTSRSVEYQHSDSICLVSGVLTPAESILVGCAWIVRNLQPTGALKSVLIDIDI